MCCAGFMNRARWGLFFVFALVLIPSNNSTLFFRLVAAAAVSAACFCGGGVGGGHNFSMIQARNHCIHGLIKCQAYRVGAQATLWLP